MRVLAVSKEELVILSLISGIKYSQNTIMKKLNNYKDTGSIVDKETYIKITKRFFEDHLVIFDEKKRLQPTNETLLLFDLINAPDKCFKLTNKMKPELGVMYYCEKGDVGVLMTISPNEKFVVVNYLFSREVLAHWLEQEVVGDLGVEKEEYSRIFVELNAQTYQLFMLMTVYNNTFDELGDKKFRLRDLVESEFLERLEFSKLIGIQNIKVANIVEHNRIDEQIDELLDAELIYLMKDKFVMNQQIGQVFNPKNYRVIMSFKEEGFFERQKILYVTNYGYLILEQVSYQPITIKISVLPLTTKPDTLLSELLSFSEVRLTQEMQKVLKEKIKKHT